MSPRLPLSPERETRYLRASVVDAALTLGPNVASLIFADSILENSSESDRGTKLLYIPDLRSLSPSTAAGPFSAFSHDTDISSGSSSYAVGLNGTNESDEYSHGPSKKAKRMPNKNRPESPFVIISKADESQNVDANQKQLNGTPSKKGIKNFIFPPRRHHYINNRKDNSLEKGQITTSKSNPPRLLPALDDPVIPIIISMPTPPPLLQKSLSQSEGSMDSAQSSPIDPRKRIIRRGGSDDLNLSSPGKTTSSGVLVKPRRKVLQDEDSGYVSEGTGLLTLKSKIRRKGKRSSPSPSNENLFLSNGARPKLSSSPQSESPPISLPIAERFVRKKPPPLTSLKSVRVKLPPAINVSTVPDDVKVNVNISLPNSSLLVAGAPQLQVSRPKDSPMSDASFVMVPDYNIMKRLGLDRYVSGVTNGRIGADNEIKLQLMEMLLKNSNVSGNDDAHPLQLEKSLEKSKNPPSPTAQTDDTITSPIPTINIVQPHELKKEQISLTSTPGTPMTDLSPPPIYTPMTPMIRGKHAPFPKTPIIRGRESPFPVRPIMRPATTPTTPFVASPSPRSRSRSPNPVPLRFNLPPLDRHKDVDLPRSVRSSYEKDLEREEEEAPLSTMPIRMKAKANVGVDGYNKYNNDRLDSPSIYSNYLDGDY